MKTLLLILLLSFSIAFSGLAQDTIRLKEYFRELRQVEVAIEGQPYRFLFDTGGGETYISPEVARKLGKKVYGQSLAYRMSGEQFTYQKADTVEMRIGNVSLSHATVGVWDVMSILPQGLPRLDGVLSLKSFRDRILTIDLAADRLILETPTSFRRLSRNMTQLPSRFANGLDGGELNIFLSVPYRDRAYWLLFDTGNISELLLSHHTAAEWGLQPDTLTQRVVLNPVAIQLGRRKLISKAAADSIIYDGVLNHVLLRQNRYTINFPKREVWLN